MPDRIISVRSSNDGVAIPSGGMVEATVTYRCRSEGLKLSASGVTEGFTVSVQPTKPHSAEPGIAASEVTFKLIITRTSAAPGAFCKVEFSMNARGSSSAAQHYQVE